jgi:galactonate dehydratase
MNLPYTMTPEMVADAARVLKPRILYPYHFGDTKEKLIQGCVDAKKKGFTAVGHLTPFLDESRDVPYFKTYADKIQDAIDTVRRYREAVGNEVDLCIEIHRRLTPAEAVTLAEGIAPYHPMFYEDPIPLSLPIMSFSLSVQTAVGLAVARKWTTFRRSSSMIRKQNRT